jgi:hypothetical protein
MVVVFALPEICGAQAMAVALEILPHDQIDVFTITPT